MDWPLKIQGRYLTETEINEVGTFLEDHPSWNRTRLSQELCKHWDWKRPDGQIKDMACRELLRKLEFRALIKLPARQSTGPGRLPTIEPVEVNQNPISCLLSDIKPVKVVDARNCTEHEKAFNYLVKQYHYLSYGRPVGQNMKYLILGRDERFMGCLLFGAAAWRIEARDRWIGWAASIRERNLGLICNNTRFLILNWVKIPHLASHALGYCLRRLPRDWKRRYGTEIAMVETFVDTTRYLGTCYKASNWIKIGRTKGRSRQDRNNKLKVPIKDILVYPLRRDFRKVLLAREQFSSGHNFERIGAVTVDSVITSVLGVEDFAEYEKDVYGKYQEMAEREIITKINALLSNIVFLNILKQWGSQCACGFLEYREITIRLKSGQRWKVLSPVFLKAKPKRKRGKPPKRQKGALRHLGLELLGIIKRVSPALIEICVSMAVLCPSFEVAANALRGLGIAMNEHLLQNITLRFAGLAKNVRIECNGDPAWQKPGIKILICVDGGRIRERRKKRGKRKKGQKRQGYHTDWFEPRLLTISQFDENGKKIKSITPILDGSCGSFDDFFELLKEYLLWINLDEATEIVFSADGGNGIWARIDNLISELGLVNAKRILDYTHAKQNINIVKKIVSDALKLSSKEIRNFSTQIRELLWNGDIAGIADLVREKLKGKRKAPKAAMKKLNDYFGDHSKFQYKTFRDNGLPTGSGTVESAIRRVINLRIKGTGLFWKREHAENIIFLRSLVLTGKLRNACRKALGVVRNMFDNNIIGDLSLAGYSV